MMGKTGTKAAKTAAPPDAKHGSGHAQPELSEEDKSKDAFFGQVAELADAMIASHGKDFAMGALVLSAKFIAEGKPLINRTEGRS